MSACGAPDPGGSDSGTTGGSDSGTAMVDSGPGGSDSGPGDTDSGPGDSDGGTTMADSGTPSDGGPVDAMAFSCATCACTFGVPEDAGQVACSDVGLEIDCCAAIGPLFPPDLPA